MISAVVLCSEMDPRGGDARERVVRSLGWLVTGVVAGVVRDVVLAAPASLDLAPIADRVGCELVQADAEADRISRGAATSKCPRVLIVKAGFQPDGHLLEEIDARSFRPADDTAIVLAAIPRVFLPWLLPDRSPVVGILAPRDRVSAVASFAELVRSCRRSAQLTARARPIF